MDESQLLKRLLGLEDSSRLLGIQIQLWESGKERDEFISQKEQVDNEITYFKKQLEEIGNKTFSKSAKQNMIDQLREYKNQIGDKRSPIRLSRFESITMEDSLFINIASHTRAIANGKQIGLHIPFLEFTYHQDNSIETEDVLDFLNQEIQILRDIEDPNFIKLKAYYEEFQQRLINRYRN